MDNPEKLATYGTQDEEKLRETGNIWVHKTRKNTEKLATYGYTRRRKTQRNWQHMGTQDEEKHRETGNIWVHKTKKTKQKHNAICVGHHYAQTNTNNANKTYRGKLLPCVFNI